MIAKTERILFLILASLFLLSVLACNLLTMPGINQTIPTPTSTIIITPNMTITPTVTPILSGPSTPEATLPPNQCKGLSGELEIEILVGPAAAVGLEPFSLGRIPFTVTDQEPFTVQGKTHLAYNKTKNYSWGTYTVTLDMDVNLAGECNAENGENPLHVVITLSGSQTLVVVYRLTTQTYPWSGTAKANADFPIQNGATVKGEGYIFILHLNNP